jgi:hypothetical protein
VAEAVMLVCDECGRPDASTITIRTPTGNYAKDLCDTHLKALLANTRAPRRGRPPAANSAKSPRAKRGSRRGGRTAKTTTRKRTVRKSARRKVGAAAG